MQQFKSDFDLTRILFSLIILSLFIISCLYIALPFTNGLAWSTLIVVATWPVLIKLQRFLWHSRLLATSVMLLLIIVVCILPLDLVITNLVKTLPALLHWLKNAPQLPEFIQLKSVPFVGDSLFQSWQKIRSIDSLSLIQNLTPHSTEAVSWVLSQLVNISHFFIDAFFMVIFSAAFYLRGEVLIQILKQLVQHLAPTRGQYALELSVKTVRAVAVGIVITAFVQATLAGILFIVINMPFNDIFTLLVFLCCLIQIGAFLVLLPCGLWFYWQGHLWIALLLVILSIVLSIIDSSLRPILISKGAKLPFALILIGVFGGLIAFGLIGLFVGPVILAVSYKLLLMWSSQDQFINNPKQ